jgi:exodeoxyribonuclease VII large subunit
MSYEDLPLFNNNPNAPPKHWSVTELTAKIRGVLEPSFNEVWVQGEVSNYRPAASGHLYFSLKDSGSSISAAVFGWGARKKPLFEVKDGLQVLCRGKISVYPPRGSYQLVIDQLEPLGAGALQLAFEQMKSRLAAEGLFAQERKRPLPLFPKKIAVITSPTGAAIQDMINVMNRRAPHVEILVIPAVVQGEGAAVQLIRGLEAANRHHLADLIILARGGGSIEDLWCFNDENLARAIFNSQLPVISAVGHEIDFTIADFVADLRAPTPSAAAEIVTRHWMDIIQQLKSAQDRIQFFISRDLQNKRSLLSHLSARVINPIDRLREQAQRTDELYLRMERSLKHTFEKRRLALGQILGKMDALSPLKVLERGYSIMKSKDGRVIRSQKQLTKNETVTVTFHDGQAQAQII